MAWTDEYINIPFKPDGRDCNGLDCFGLVRLVYKEKLGIDLPSFSGIFSDQSPATLRKVAKVMKLYRERWTKVDPGEQRIYDAIMLRTGAYTWHVGLVIDRRNMLHIMAGIESCVEEYTGLLWRDRIDEFRRYHG